MHEDQPQPAPAVPPAADLPAPADVPPQPTVALLTDPAAIPVWQPAPGDRVWRWGTIGLVFALYLLNAGSFGLWDPWETHYGEVTRYMVETYDWVNPWWGYQQKIGAEPIAGEWFYSKPVFIFWAEAAFIRLIGLTDWALRLPLALLGASLCSVVYLVVERLGTRQQAVVATAVTALSPFVYMVSRQAQTDLPYVSLMTMGLLAFAAAFFGRRTPLSARGFGWATAGFVAWVLLNLGPQLSIIATDLYDPNAGAGRDGLAAWGDIVQQNGVYHLLFYVPVALLVLASVLVPVLRQRRRPEGWDAGFRDRWVRRYLLLSGYMMFAWATYAKGLLGFMLPGAVLVLYLLASRQWRLLGRIELVRGVPLFFVTVLPWYVAMFCRHGMPYYNRFFIHDHFNRVGAGVHQIDTGTFEYFVEWLGYGLFPWSAFVPLVLVAAAGWLHVRTVREPGRTFEADAVDHLQVLAFVWFSLAFFLFTLSSTRFHHYILPGVPALGMLVGLYLERLRRDRTPAGRTAVVLALVVFVALLVNLMGDYQNLRNLFTYKYDRPLPDNLPTDWTAPVVWAQDTHPILTWGQTPFGRHVGPFVAHILSIRWFRFETFWLVAGTLGGLGLVAMLWARLRTAGLWLLGGTALLIAFWALNWYMPTLAPHWSQKYLFEAYYGDCTRHPNPPQIEDAYTPLVRRAGLDFVADFFDAQPKRVCREDIVSWLITWRGETYYSNNEIRPLNKATQLTPYLREMNKGRTFYALLERGRTSGFASKVKAEARKLRDEGATGFADVSDWTVDLISNDSAYFVLARVVPVRGGPLPGAKPAVRPGLGLPRPPRVVPQAPPGDEPKEERGSSPNPSF